MSSTSLPDRNWHHLVLHEASGWHASLVRLGVLFALFAALFQADLVDLVSVWLESTPYSHCVFVPAIIGWMIWQRRDGLRQLAPQGWWTALAWLGAGAFVWLLGWAGGLALFRHAALIIMAQGIVMTTLGPAVARALLFPLFYGFFMIPVGTEAEPVLQIMTARMAINMLWLAGVPAEISGIFITTPNGYFRVAEACSGTGFLIAMTAFATLVAHLCFKQPLRRALFIAGSLLICLLGNGIRAFGIIFIAYHSSVDSAVVVDHVLYGWLFFALVIAAVLALGWPFFDRSPFEKWFDPGRLQGAADARHGVSWGILLVAAILMVTPVAWSTASRAFSAPLPPMQRAPAITGWSQEEASVEPAWRPHFTGADRIEVFHYRDARNHPVELAIVTFAYQAEGKELVGFGQGAAAPDGEGAWTWAAPAAAPKHARAEIIQGPDAHRRLTYSFYHVGGRLTGQASRVKVETLKVRLLGGDQRAVAIILSTPVLPAYEAEAERTLADFLTALGPVEDLADHSLAIR